MDGATTPGFRDGWYASRSDGVWDGLVRQGANKHQGLAGASPCKRASEGLAGVDLSQASGMGLMASR